jgi:ABC-2 type transport system ATP-binding protein
VRAFILELKKEKTTIFMNTHNLDEAGRICDRIGILKTHLIAVDSRENLETSTSNRKTVVHLENVSNAVLTAIKKLSAVKNTRTSENKLILDVDNPEKDNPQLVRAIVMAGGNVQFVTELRSTLEYVYLKLIREAEVQ